MEKLRQRVGDGPNRKFIEADFLDPTSTDTDYDVIYAHAVLHHFRYIEPMLQAARGRLVHKGQMITYDPLQTWIPIRVFRALFRPFQTDADWEFPFTAKSMTAIEANFQVKRRLGVFNRGKWALILGILAPRLGRKYGDRLFLADFAPGADTRLTASLHISYNLQNP